MTYYYRDSAPSYAYVYKLKENTVVTPQELEEQLYLQWGKRQKEETGGKCTLHIGYSYELLYREPFYGIFSASAKLRFVLAGLFNDEAVIKWIKEMFPYVDDLRIPTHRDGFNVQHILQDLGVTFQEFIMNSQYVVIIDDGRHWGKMVYNYLIDMDKFTDDTKNQDIAIYGDI